MLRVLIAECKQEVSTFNPQLSGYADFAMRFGEALVQYHRTVRNEVGGALDIFGQRSDIEIVPTGSAFFITSGGTLAEEAWQRLSGELLASIREAGKVDAVYFCMHGAMATQHELDPEGWLLTETRKIVGPSVPIVVSLDLHGILTDRMLDQSDAIVAYHTYPHVDFFETGQRAARLLLKIIDGAVKPVTAKVAIPALVRGDELITATGLFGESIRIAQAIENGPSGLSAGMFIGNPFTDVPALQTYSFVVTNNDPSLAEREALRIADSFWKNHERMFVPLKSLAELQQVVLQPHPGTLGLVDAADATSSGASGDSNAVLRALMECGYTATHADSDRRCCRSLASPIGWCRCDHSHRGRWNARPGSLPSSAHDSASDCAGRGTLPQRVVWRRVVRGTNGCFEGGEFYVGGEQSSCQLV